MIKTNLANQTIHARGDIGYDDGITTDAMMDALGEFDGSDVTIRLTSNGGEVFEGLALYNLLAEYPGKVDVIVDSLAASIATIVMLAGDSLRATANARVMVHNSATLAIGGARDFRGIAQVLDSIDLQMATHYAEASGTDVETWRKMMDAETWLDAKAAVEIGLIASIRSKPGRGES